MPLQNDGKNETFCLVNLAMLVAVFVVVVVLIFVFVFDQWSEPRDMSLE